jgi:hypothetical protein
MTAIPGDCIFAPDEETRFKPLVISSDSVPVDGMQGETKVNRVDEPGEDSISGEAC